VLEVSGVNSTLKARGIQVRAAPSQVDLWLGQAPRACTLRQQRPAHTYGLSTAHLGVFSCLPACLLTGVSEASTVLLAEEACDRASPTPLTHGAHGVLSTLHPHPPAPQEGDSVVIGEAEFEWSDDQSEGAMFDAWEADMKERGQARTGSKRWPRGAPKG